MIPLHSILAAEGSSLPTIVLVVAGVVLALAFVMGFVKGFRKVSWDGLTWLVAGGLFFALGLVAAPVGSTAAGGFTIALVVALLCIGGALALHGVATYFLRPKIRWIKDDVSSDMSLAEYGLEFEPEYTEYDGEHEYVPYGKRIYKTGYGAPSFFARLMGGLTCVINVGVVLWALLAAFLLIANMFSGSNATLGAFFSNEIMGFVFDTGKDFLFDFLMIVLIIYVAKMGQKKGFLESLRYVLISVCYLVVLLGSFYLAFTTPVGEGVIGQLVANCKNAFADIELVGDVLGGLLAALCLLTVFSILVMLLNVLLKKLCEMIGSIGITRGLDSCLACALYMIIGAVACLGIWCVFAGLEVLGVFSFSSLIGDGAYLSRALFDFAKSIVGPFFA